jgi:acetylornithine deacetylase/succinyl-diaminopimelate desuccinylase-like protein
MIHAAIALHRARVALHGRLRLTAVMGEEEGQIGIRHLLDLGLTADAFISTQWSTAAQIAVGYRGLCWIEVTTTGRAAHGSRPSSGINAVEQMLDVVLPALRGLKLAGADSQVIETPGFSVNLSRIGGGDAANTVPDSCRATLDYRLGNGQCSGEVQRAIETELARLRASDPTLAVQFQVLLRAEPFLTDPSCDLVQRLSRAVVEVTRQSPRYFGKTGTGEANLVYQRLGIPVVAYGPGNESGHSPDEYVVIEDLERVSEVYVRTISAYLNAPSRESTGSPTP